jgi:hypothetical protein
VQWAFLVSELQAFYLTVNLTVKKSRLGQRLVIGVEAA